VRVSFSEKKFNEWINERVNFFDKMYGLPADLERAARWGYEEANRNADDAEANGKIIGYDLAVAELKARDAQRLTKINAEIKNTTNILEKASREQKTGDNEVYLTMAGRLGGLRFLKKLLLV